MDPSSFLDVLRVELAYIRRRRFGPKPPRRVKDSLVGLALSGGGIRSATTNLGILQTLSSLGVLPLVDYICTVSGGGYIGSCLSSLLSLDDKAPPEVLAPGSRPMFTTEWDQFPFNPTTPRGEAQIRHLRTHGSFLVTRKGVFRSETLRSIGQLLSGTVYHLVLALLTLSTAALFYMTVLFFGSPDVDNDLRQVTKPVRTYSTAYEARIQTGAPPAYSPDSATELTGEGDARYTIPVVYVYPGLLDRLASKLLVIAGQVRRIPAGELWLIVGSTVLTGILVAVGAFFYLRGRCQKKLSTPPKPGESIEDARAFQVLRAAGLASLAAVAVSLAAVLAWIHPAPAPLWLVLPIVAILGVRITSWVLHVMMPRFLGTWNRDMRSLWGAYEAIAVYALWGTIIFSIFPVLVYALREHTALIGVSGVLALIAARLLTLRNGFDRKKRPITSMVLRVLLAVAIGVGLLLIVVTLCAVIVPDAHSDAMWVRTGVGAAVTGGVLLLLGICGDANRLSPHYFYRDRLAEAYLYTEEPRVGTTSLERMRDNVELELRNLHGVRNPLEPATTAPFHLISCAINLAGSRDLTRKDRKSGYFFFSKYFCGSRHTGYRPTAEYIGGDMKLARAVTISGAAAGSGIGAGTFFAQAFATVLFNLRLGYWMPNPIKTTSTFSKAWSFWPKWLWREVTLGTDESHSMVNLSDGGHTGDNIGLYPLLQRRCKLIIACDAECDPSLSFGSFTEAIRHAYIDLGVDIDIDLTMLRQDRETGMSRSHCAVGLIRYPARIRDAPPMVGYLVYLKNSITGDEPEPVLNYKSSNPAFPHESTADQFFDDAQFESYRSLGVHIAEHAFGRWTRTSEFGKWQAAAAPAARPTV